MKSLRVIFVNATPYDQADQESDQSLILLVKQVIEQINQKKSSNKPSYNSSDSCTNSINALNAGLRADAELIAVPDLQLASELVMQLKDHHKIQPNCPNYQFSQTSERINQASVILWPLSNWQVFERSLPVLNDLLGLAPIIIISDQPELAPPRLQELGIWDVISSADLTLYLARTLIYVERTFRAEQKAISANFRIQQATQFEQRQEQVIAAQAQQIQQLETQLELASQSRGLFLRTVSHELRTPMNAIIGFSQFLRRGHDTLSPRQFELIERIFSNATKLLSLIDQILNFAKLEAGQLTIQPKWFDLDHLLWAVVDQLQPEASQKGLGFQVRVGKVKIMTDPTYLQQVIYNLLANAVKFTTSGYITVTVEVTVEPIAESVAESRATQGRVVILIRDTGIGMQSAEIQHIFEPFRQVDQSLTRQYQGLGLGLAVTASLVQKLQGTITVKSQVGQGSEFRIELPICLKTDETDGPKNNPKTELKTRLKPEIEVCAGRFQKI
jgi:signal transduction histidine kinase